MQLVELVTLLDDRSQARSASHRRDDRPYAYVDPTHAIRVKDRHDRPRRLVEAVMPGKRRTALPPRARAPGRQHGAPVHQARHRGEVTRARIEDAVSAGAQVLITEDPGTLYHLSRYAKEYGVEVAGLYELLAAHLARGRL